MYNNYEERIELLNKQLVSEYKKNDELEKRIKEAIEYIEESLNIIDNEVMIESKNIKNYYLLPLLQILKGENNE